MTTRSMDYLQTLIFKLVTTFQLISTGVLFTFMYAKNEQLHIVHLDYLRGVLRVGILWVLMRLKCIASTFINSRKASP